MLNVVIDRVRHVAPDHDRLAPLDPWLVFPAIGLIAFGVLMVTSASMPIADRQADAPLYFLYREFAYVALGLLLGWLAFQVEVETWYRRGPAILMVVGVLLVLVLIPGIGRRVNGSWRWINLGIMNVQVSELAKLASILYVAGYLRRHAQALRESIVAMIRPLMVLGVLALLLLMEPDFGATMVIIAVALGLVFLGGVNFWQFSAMQLLVVGGMAVLLWSSPYRRARLSSFLNPWEDPFNKGFQLTQSLIAIGRGEWFGVGLGSSVQKLFYLPEVHTDFVFAVIAEEAGFVGCLTVIGLFVFLIWRIFYIGGQAERAGFLFNAYVTYGIGLLIGIQAFVNIGVNMGILPTKGLPLPFLSYGSNNLVVTLGAIGIALRAGIEAHEVTYPRATAPQIMTAPPTSGDDEYDDDDDDDAERDND